MNKGSVLISDLKQDLKTIKEIANNERYFKRFLDVNQKFIYNIVHKTVFAFLKELKRNDLNFDIDSLHQIGRLSLHHAMNRFTKNKSATLSTFAYKVIKNDISRELQLQLRVIFNEESIESFSRNNGNGDMINYEYDERHFVPTHFQGHTFEEKVLNKMVFEKHFNELSNQNKAVLQMLIEGKQANEIKDEINLTSRQLRKIKEKELPNKLMKMKKELMI